MQVLTCVLRHTNAQVLKWTLRPFEASTYMGVRWPQVDQASALLDFTSREGAPPMSGAPRSEPDALLVSFVFSLRSCPRPCGSSLALRLWRRCLSLSATPCTAWRQCRCRCRLCADTTLSDGAVRSCSSPPPPTPPAPHPPLHPASRPGFRPPSPQPAAFRAHVPHTNSTCLVSLTSAFAIQSSDFAPSLGVRAPWLRDAGSPLGRGPAREHRTPPLAPQVRHRPGVAQRCRQDRRAQASW